MIIIKSEREIALMREAGYILSDMFEELAKHVKPGVSTLELDAIAAKFAKDRGASMAELGYQGYPASICASINDTILHGIPSNKEVLKDGDIISLDIVVRKNGYCADACRTYMVGEVSSRAKAIVEAAESAFYAGLKFLKPGNRLGDVQHAIGMHARSKGYFVPRDYTGHGIGRDMHEDPYIPNYGNPGTGIRLRPGMTLAIEPMLLEFSEKTYVTEDGWTVKSSLGGLTSHYENTLAITEDGYEILTIRKEKEA